MTIEATGPLPAPTMGALDGPPRVFLDFAGVLPKTAGVASSADPRVRRVRVALHSANPPITRVVVDLTSQQPSRLELGNGRVKIFIGSAAVAGASTAAAPVVPKREPAPPVRPPSGADSKPIAPTATAQAQATPASASIPPVPPLPPPMSDADVARNTARTSSPNAATNAPRTPYRPPTPPPPSKDVEKYRAMAGNILDRLKLQMPLLAWMESMEEELGRGWPRRSRNSIGSATS